MVTAISRLIHYLRGTPQTDLKGTFILWMLVSCFLVLTWIAARRESRIRSLAATTSPTLLKVLVPATIPAPSPPALTPVPKLVDLQGEILEVYFNDSFPTPIIGRKYVLMRVRIVNRGPNEATITHCGLQVSLGAFRATGAITDIPSVWRIRKQSDNAFLGSLYEDTPPIPRLGAQPHEEIYKQGHPREGWLNFEFYLQNVDFPNAEFKILLKDSLGGEHSIHRPSGVYVRMGDLVTSVPLIPSPSGEKL